MEQYKAWDKSGEECVIEIETVESDPTQYRIIRQTPGMTEILESWTDVRTLGIVPEEWAASTLADEIAERYDMTTEGPVDAAEREYVDDMTPTEAWQQFVGDQTPTEFMSLSKDMTVCEAVDEYLTHLDEMFGEGASIGAPGNLSRLLFRVIDADALARRVGELVALGLSANEATVHARVGAGEAVGVIARDQGVSQQAVSDALRRAKIKIAGKG